MTLLRFLLLISAFQHGYVHAADAGDQLYRLGTGDRLRIEIHGEEVLANGVVGDSGALTLPYIGSVQIADRTSGEVRDAVLAQLVPDYFVDPDVIVSVEEYRSFFLYGQVSSPGSFPFEPGLTVGKAIALAGGLTDRASRRRIFLVRDSDPTGEGIRVDESYSVQPGDVITIEQSFF